MLCLLHSFDKFLLLHTPLTVHSSVCQNLFQLLHPQFGDVFRIHFFRLDWKLDGANFRIALVDALTHLECGHTERKGLRHVAFDRINVIANFLFFCAERLLFAVRTEGLFDLGLFAGVLFAEVVFDIVNNFDADCC